MSINFLKRDCHRMMQIMWGDTPKGTKKSYIWLSQNLGYDIHFTTASQRDINEAHKLLFKRMIKYNFEYLDDKKVIIPPIKKIKEQMKKETKRNKIKPQIAKNLKELQKHKTTIYRKTWWQKLKDWLTNSKLK